MRVFAFSVATVFTALTAPSALAQTSADWSGFYAGLTAGTNRGEQDYYNNGLDYYFKGETYGLIAGYNQATAGPWVYGAELGLIGGSVYEEDIDTGEEYPEYEFNRFIDAKARVGYAVDDYLFYGALGYSHAEWSEGGDPYSGGGPLFALGVDYRVADRYFIGAEIQRRDLHVNYPFEATVDTLSIRAGLSF
jgi:outer membrane immunogenic protein